jgi:aldose 1-epimerase
MNITKQTVATSKGDATLYTITNSSGASVTLSSIGAGIVSVVVPDKNGTLADVVLGYENAADYLYDGPCAGKIPGRYANRIARGRFEIDGRVYNLAINNGPNALHGGPEGFQNQIWASRIEGDSVVFELTSPDGDEGYPGTMVVTAIYRWTEDNTLQLNLEARTDADTVVNLTNHAYFNLDGHDAGSVLEHTLQLNADCYLPTDDTLIPQGAPAPVACTPMDFTQAHAIGDDINADFPALHYGKGYDNCWVLKDDQFAAVLHSAKSGRTLRVTTNQPGVQVYSGNWLSGCPKGKGGAMYNDYDGVAIECQAFPDAPNRPDFPSSRLNAGEVYKRHITFNFSVE